MVFQTCPGAVSQMCLAHLPQLHKCSAGTLTFNVKDLESSKNHFELNGSVCLCDPGSCVRKDLVESSKENMSDLKTPMSVSGELTAWRAPMMKSVVLSTNWQVAAVNLAGWQLHTETAVLLDIRCKFSSKQTKQMLPHRPDNSEELSCENNYSALRWVDPCEASSE